MYLLYINSMRIDHILFVLSFFIVIISFWGIATYISLSVVLIFSIILFLSIIFYLKQIKIKQWIVNILSIIFLVLPFLGFSMEDIILPSVEALALIAALRFLGNKTSREYFQIYLMSLLLLGASTIFNISWIFLLRLGIVFVSCLFSILIITYLKETSNKYIEKSILSVLLKYTFIILIFSIPLSILFFIFLPRTPYPLLDIGLASAKTGFSSTVSVGNISLIEEDKSVVMRVKMEKIDSSQLYWRMTTFDNFDGRMWTRTENLSPIEGKILGDRIRYFVVFEPSVENYLPVLDFPSNVYLQNLILEYPGIYKTKYAIDKPLRYVGESYVNYKYYDEKPDKRYLQLPANITKRFIVLTEEITSKSLSKEEIVINLMNFLKNYEYSLKGLPKGNDPIDDFIFNTKRGNCEYFATTMALMLRINGIHSRVVGGFRGGSYNIFGGYYLVRASDAHLWVEAWIDGVWMRYDPSGARPLRIREPVIFNFFDYFWHNLVINYNFTSQIKLAKIIKSPQLHFHIKYLLISFFCLILIVLIYSLKGYKINRLPLKRFLKIMKKGGFERTDNQGLEEFVNQVSDMQIKEKAMIFVNFYLSVYFKDKKFSKDELGKLKYILEELDETVKSKRGKFFRNN